MAYYDKKPSVFEAVGNGSYLYRYNIVEVEAPSEEETRTQWQCEEVTVWLPLSSNKVTEAVISTKWDNNYEQKLTNEYNAAVLGLYEQSVADAKIEKYKAFLVERDALKAQIDKDWKDYELANQ